eukprot:CAMPEP_0114662952 /NCGR_PEP_ID=MMETSP0191-20121206/25971_1 /TAXON_ID=126664 /ORGANISM="Sorites sp." /LENGTH=82 /DNA_ID=CAMNT_0001900907 /DNA_START=2476 /DNA_END=2724 /DNA_ORIENTATION=-
MEDTMKKNNNNNDVNSAAAEGDETGLMNPNFVTPNDDIQYINDGNIDNNMDDINIGNDNENNNLKQKTNKKDGNYEMINDDN